MATIRKLTVPFLPQLLGHYCGPACAQMILAYWGHWDSQDNLWTLIKSKTTGTRPPSAPPTPGQFPKQRCDHCGAWHCWDTHPDSLSAAINAHGQKVSHVVTSYLSTIDETILALVDSVDALPATPPCASFYAVNHWIVVYGYHLDDPHLPGAPPYQVGTLQLNGLYVHNPNVSDTVPTIGMYSTAQFRMSLGAITCGAHIDRYPVIRYSFIRSIIRYLLYVVHRVRRWWLALFG